MPELPEVETVKNGLIPVLEGARLEKVTIRTPRLRLDIPADFRERTEGKTVLRLARRSKYILIYLSGGETVLLHLGMSGRLRIHAPEDGAVTIGKHDHVSFVTDGGHHILFTDPRRFGVLTLFNGGEEGTHPLLASIGPEPLGNDFNESVLRTGLSRRKSPVKTALLDQKLVAGLGNIYVCEALWHAGVNPTRPANTIREDEVVRLVPIIREVLRDAIAAGGSSLKDFSGTDGELGYFQHRFRAYGREGEACSKSDCGGTVQRMVQSNRSTFFCPSCQT